MDQKNFLVVAQGLRLSASEKARMRESLFADIERSQPQAGWSMAGFLRLFSGCMAALLVLVLSGAGITYAAESALPGDALYSVKVKITEPLLISLNSSTEAKVRVRAHLATRRLREAEKLAEKSDLTPEKAAIVHSHLTAHVEALESDLKKLESEDKESSTAVGIDTSTELEAHENVLLQIVADKDRESAEIIVNTARKGRRYAIEASRTVDENRQRFTEQTAKKAQDAIVKARLTVKESDEVVSDTLMKAEEDLKASVETEADGTIHIEKATSALRQAKEATIMLEFKGRTFLKIRDPKPVKDPDALPLPDPTSQSSEQSSVVSSVISPVLSPNSATSSSPSSSTSRTSSALSAATTSSSTAMTSSATSETSLSSISANASVSISASASVSASTSSAGDILKKTDELIEKTLPKL